MPQDVLARNNVKVFGKGTQPLLFAHGFGCDQNMWRFVTPAFEDQYQIVLLDYVGAGKSDLTAYSPERYGRLDGYAQDILDVCEALALSDIIFVGHSVSGVVGLLAAIREPERFERLLLVSPSPRYLNDPPDYVGGFEQADIQGLLQICFAGLAMRQRHSSESLSRRSCRSRAASSTRPISFPCSNSPVKSRRSILPCGQRRERICLCWSMPFGGSEMKRHPMTVSSSWYASAAAMRMKY
jgi:pimeloyl-ACP methyl ester carboxylesterase